MSYRIVSLMILLFVLTVPMANAGEGGLFERVAEVIRRHCPEAEIKTESNRFVAKHGTMIFTVHRKWMTGEIGRETFSVEGPNFKGFLLTISFQEGRYSGQAIVPQILREPYWETFIDRPPTEDGKGHYVFNFSYGPRVNRDLKEAIFKLFSLSGRQFNDGAFAGGDG